MPHAAPDCPVEGRLRVLNAHESLYGQSLGQGFQPDKWREPVVSAGLETGPRFGRRWVAAFAAAVLCLVLSAPAQAGSTVDFLNSLSDSEASAFQDWKAARRAYEQKLDTYWDQVDAKRQARKPKRAAKLAFDASDYIMSFPPVYNGPKLGAALAKKYEKIHR